MQTKYNYSYHIMVAIIFLAGIAATFILMHHQPAKAQQDPSALVKTSPAKKIPIAKKLATYGVVNVAPENIQQVTIQNEALVQQIFVTQGQHVNKGGPLLRLSTTANASLNLENLKMAVEFSKIQLARLEKLRTQYLATNAEVQTEKQNLAKSEAALNNLINQQKNETGKVLESNCNCSIISINVQPGQIALPATALITYANTSHVQIRLGVENDDLSKVRVGQKVVITAIYNHTKSENGFISSITNQIDSKTGLVDVIVSLENVIGLIPGSMVQGDIYLEPIRIELAVPRSAVLFQNNQPYLFVDRNGKAEQRNVVIGEDTGTFVTIKRGVKENELVVTAGNYELKNGMALRVEHQ